jgi:hypothetical protein
MPSQGLEHVIEEADPGFYLGFAPAIQVDPNPEIGLLGAPSDFSGSRHELTVRPETVSGKRWVSGER